ncbi:MAG: 50S ribosomal protein L1 [Candidatus Woykebacteria bacterium]
MGQQRKTEVKEGLDEAHLKKIEEIEKKPVVVAQSQDEKKGKTKPPKVRSRRFKELVSLLDKSKDYSLPEAVALIKKTANTKFDATIEAHINLGISADKAENQIRTLVSLPHKVGKKLKILVFSSKNTAEIKKLGAEIGTEEVLKNIEAGKIEAGKIISDSAWMAKLAKVAKILGPKGLMPNPKSGTVTDDPLKALQEFSGGKLEIKTEKSPIIHVQIGKASFSEKQILENLHSLIEAIKSAKPEGLKKEFIKNIFLSSTMGPSIKTVPNPEPVDKEK